MRSLLIPTVLLICLSKGAYAQAFGITQGAPINSLSVLDDYGDGYYSIEVPNPVSYFESYVAFGTQDAGVCLVKGIGKTHKRDGYGIEVRQDFDELRTALDEKYGAGETHSGLRTGALWDDVDEWIMAIFQNERYHQAEWELGGAEGIDDIILSIAALSSNESYAGLQYRFANMAACQNEIAEVDKGGL